MRCGNLGGASQKIYEEYLAVSGSVCVKLRRGKKKPTHNPHLENGLREMGIEWYCNKT
jgi:hypothetical protein